MNLPGYPVRRWMNWVRAQPSSNPSLTVPRYTNGRACDLNGLQEITHVSRLSFFTHSCTRSFSVSSLKERNYTYSMYLSTVKVGLKSCIPRSCDFLSRYGKSFGCTSAINKNIAYWCLLPATIYTLSIKSSFS